MQSFQSFQESPEIVLYLKCKNYKKAKIKGGLGWMKNIGSYHRSLFSRNHFSSSYTMGSRGISSLVSRPLYARGARFLPRRNKGMVSTVLRMR